MSPVDAAASGPKLVKRPPLLRSQSDSRSSDNRIESGTGNVWQRDKSTMPAGMHRVDALPAGAPKSEARDPFLVGAYSPVAQPTPERPVRNPARSLASSQSASPQLPTAKKKKSSRPSTATGTREEVTPWELYPAPEVEHSGQEKGQIRTQQHPQPHPPVSSGHGSGFLLRRRKSTGSKPPLVKVNAHIAVPSPVASPAPLSHATANLLMRHPPHITNSKAPSNPSLPLSRSIIVTNPLIVTSEPLTAIPQSPPPTATTPRPKDTPAPPVPPPQTSDATSNLKFSTADRTILEELKRTINAKASQFIVKGPNFSRPVEASIPPWGVEGIGSGKKHHPYPKEEVPYPRNYEREVLDMDVWESAWAQQICGSLTYHVFDTPPTKVLDLGCGTGTWVIKSAQAWKECHFVGLDIVPLHPDLHQVGPMDLASRITWVQANFLECLPFPNEEFDYVHVKRIGLGVPEDKWDTLFEEITRVMKPGGAFELIEEDLFFPGKPVDSDEPEDSEHGSTSATERISRNDSRSITPENHDRPSLDADSLFASSRSDSSGSRPSDEIHSSATDDTSPITASPSVAHFPPGVLDGPPTSKYLPMPSEVAPPIREGGVEGAHSSSNSSDGHPHPIATATKASSKQEGLPGGASPRIGHRSLLKSPSMVNISALRNGHASSATPATKSTLPPIRIPNSHSLRPRSQGKFTESTEWLMSSLAPSQGPLVRERKNSLVSSRPTSLFLGTGRRRASVNQPPPPPPPPPISSSNEQHDTITSLKAPVIRTTTLAPPNPRDHSLLKFIYDQMLASRFINTSPLSVLANLVGLHFHDVRTHPPLMITFPPLPKVDPSNPENPDEEHHRPAHNGFTDSSKALSEASTPTPKAKKSTSGYFDEQNDDPNKDDQFLSVRRLIRGASPYVTLDDTRINAYSPSTKSHFPSPTMSHFKISNTPDGTPPSEFPPPSRDPYLAKLAIMSMRKNRLPNKHLKIDLRTLNLQLALRVREVLGCSESMWEWVVGYQKEKRAKKPKPSVRPRSSSGVSDGVPSLRDQALGLSLNPQDAMLKDAVLELTREDFEGLLSNFNIDMREQTGLGSALLERLHWPIRPSSPTAEKKLFDNEYQQWLHWEQEQHPSRPFGGQSQSFIFPTPLSNIDNADTITDGSPVLRRKSVDHRPSEELVLKPRGRTSRQSLTIDHNGRSTSQYSRTSSSSNSTMVNLPPTKRLSRSFRVFVGWKPLEP